MALPNITPDLNELQFNVILTDNWLEQELNIVNHIQYPVWLNTNTQFHDIQIAITRGHHKQTQDGYESTIKEAFLVRLDQYVKCIFQHYEGK
jgi:hypothetical protein